MSCMKLATIFFFFLSLSGFFLLYAIKCSEILSGVAESKDLKEDRKKELQQLIRPLDR